jgi:transposase
LSPSPVQVAGGIKRDADFLPGRMAVHINIFYAVLDRLLKHRDALFTHLQGQWRDLFGAKLDVLLYDLTSTYFEGQAEAIPQARRGYSRDHRPDCKQVVLALIVTPEGFPVGYEIMNGNLLDKQTLPQMIQKVEALYGPPSGCG